MNYKQIGEMEESLKRFFKNKIDCVRFDNNIMEIKFSDKINEEKIYEEILSLKKRKYRKQKYAEYNAIENEIWRTIDEYPGIEVSNMGRIMKNGKIACLKENRDGYQKITIKNINNKTKSVGVHRLVALAFIPNPDNKKEVDHINTIRNDNRVENLRWVTPIENILGNDITLKRLKAKGEDFTLQMIKNALSK